MKPDKNVVLLPFLTVLAALAFAGVTFAAEPVTVTLVRWPYT